MPITTSQVIAVGASTGGTEALRDFLSQLSPQIPGLMIVQHMPEAFIRSFAARLDELCPIKVQEAVHGMPILPGNAYIAPGHSHLLLEKSGNMYRTVLSQSPPFNRHRPSVDVLFKAMAKIVGKQAVGILLTGMGKDGAAGLLEMKQAGSYNFAQNEDTCIVFGMPKEAIALGAVDEVVSIKDLAGRVTLHCQRME